MRTLKYAVRFSVSDPENPHGLELRFLLPIDVVCTDDDRASKILETIKERCIVSFWEGQGRRPEQQDINIQMITILDSHYTAEQKNEKE